MTSADHGHGLDAALLLQLLDVLEQLQDQAPDTERGHVIDLLRLLRDQLTHTPQGVDVDAAISEVRALLGTDTFDSLLTELAGTEATSLGTAGAQAVRRRTSSKAIAAVVARAAALSSHQNLFAQQQPANANPLGHGQIHAGYVPDPAATRARTYGGAASPYNAVLLAQIYGSYAPVSASETSAEVVSTGTGKQALKIDHGGNVPPSEQLRLHYALAISTRELPVGAKLPTVRALAKDLGLAANTVERAYRELEEAGLVETRGRAGTVVSGNSDSNRERVRAAATQYAAMATELGLTPQEALEIVRAAFHS
jgi:DNA-binding transcriptional regulator YhcF (GntR family)